MLRWKMVLAAFALGCCLHAGAQSGPAYDVATVRPSEAGKLGQSWHGNNNRVSMENVTLRRLIKVAYRFRSDSQVIGGPEWLGKAHFDISARMDDEEYAKVRTMPDAERQKEDQLLLQRLLMDRFGLKVRVEARDLPQFALAVDGASSKLVPPAEDISGRGQNVSVHNGTLTAKGMTMESLAGTLSNMPEAGERVVVDHTALKGGFNFELHWTPERGTGVAEDASQPGLFTALKEQLGLKLEKTEGAVPVVLVDAASMPVFD